MLFLIRNNAYYSKKRIIELISQDKVFISEAVRSSAADDFGWGYVDICSALKALQIKDCYKAETRHQEPEIWVDYYRSYVKGEHVYTHFYVNKDGLLVVDSFKERFK